MPLVLICLLINQDLGNSILQLHWIKSVPLVFFCVPLSIPWILNLFSWLYSRVLRSSDHTHLHISSYRLIVISPQPHPLWHFPLWVLCVCFLPGASVCLFSTIHFLTPFLAVSFVLLSFSILLTFCSHQTWELSSLVHDFFTSSTQDFYPLWSHCSFLQENCWYRV